MNSVTVVNNTPKLLATHPDCNQQEAKRNN
jgi:hypothetical protein